MNESPRSVYWEAPEHNHIEKTNDWYWILGIVALAGSVTSVIFGNVLFAVVILAGTMTVFVTSHKKPRTIPFEISGRGVRVENTFYPYTTLDSFCLEEEHPLGPQLIVKSKKLFAPLIILPVPAEYTLQIEKIIAARIPEEHLEEPFSHRVLEFFGF